MTPRILQDLFFFLIKLYRQVFILRFHFTKLEQLLWLSYGMLCYSAVTGFSGKAEGKIHEVFKAFFKVEVLLLPIAI